MRKDISERPIHLFLALRGTAILRFISKWVYGGNLEQEPIEMTRRS
ncbi:MAG: hypothetical protein KZQ82_20840 [Candidatus Thiodiazotropha sp. (ex Lucinoma annulata)]|nr:hypothetical protein [Candidatus Thiodiazotropha sp. (ex Lucinoma borealis)]MCU7886643.1 hypothetical protein [Candidatus Thiodiazotropha sp. (ex Lucinoma annulata)]